MSFTVLPLNYFWLVWVSFSDHPLVCLLPNHHYYPVLVMPRSIPKQKSFVLFPYSLTNSYGMHLVTPTHLSLFRVICHPSRTFLLKELKREPQNKLPPSPHYQTISSLTSDSWPTAPVLAGYK